MKSIFLLIKTRVNGIIGICLNLSAKTVGIHLNQKNTTNPEFQSIVPEHVMVNQSPILRFVNNAVMNFTTGKINIFVQCLVLVKIKQEKSLLKPIRKIYQKQKRVFILVKNIIDGRVMMFNMERYMIGFIECLVLRWFASFVEKQVKIIDKYIGQIKPTNTNEIKMIGFVFA